MRFLLHKWKFYNAFHKWFANYGKQVYSDESIEQKKQQLHTAYKFIHSSLKEIKGKEYDWEDTQYVSYLTEMGKLMDGRHELMNDISLEVENH